MRVCAAPEVDRRRASKGWRARRGNMAGRRAPMAAAGSVVARTPAAGVCPSLHMYWMRIWHSAFSDPHECCEVHAMLSWLPAM